MSLNLNIMCKHRVPGISSTLVNKIRDLLLELSGIGQKDKVMKDDQVASLASAALEGALELFLPAPEAQVTFVRHLLRGGRKKLLTRVLKHLHDSTQCTFSLVRDVRVCRFRENVHFFFTFLLCHNQITRKATLECGLDCEENSNTQQVPNPTSGDECPALTKFTKLMISSVFDILQENENDTDEENENIRKASLKLIFHLISNVSSICAMYAAVSLQDNKIIGVEKKPSLNERISVQSEKQELRSKRLAKCTSPIVDMLEIVCTRICTFKKFSKSTLLTMRVLKVLLTSLGTWCSSAKRENLNDPTFFMLSQKCQLYHSYPFIS